MPRSSLTVDQKLEAARFIQNTYKPIPHLFVKDVLGARTWPMQDEIIKSVFENKLTAVKTANACGKTWVAARIALTFLSLFEPSIVVTTAPTYRQVKDVLWREIGAAVRLSKFKLTDKEVRQTGLDISEDWFAVGLSTKQPENFFGYHSAHILVIVDEAGGVPDTIFKGVKAITPNAGAHILYIGNPTNPSGPFFDVFDNPKILAKRFTISIFDTPNFTASGITCVENLLNLFTPRDGYDPSDWVNRVNQALRQRMDPVFRDVLIDPLTAYQDYIEWGPDSNAWQSLRMGEFPSQAEQALIPADLVRMAMEMYGTDEATGKTYAELSGWQIPDGPPEYGMDIARYGGDLNVLTPRRGGWIDKQIIWNKKGDEKLDVDESADRIMQIIDPYDFNTRVAIDDTGVGGGTTATLKRLSREAMQGGSPAHQYQLVPYGFGSKVLMRQPDKFHDITSELYWNMRDWFYKKQIALHYDKDLFNQLVGRRWTITPQRKIKVESKEEYKKRTGGKSPDLSDSLCLSLSGGVRTPKKIAPVQEEQEQMPVRQPFTSGIRRGSW